RESEAGGRSRSANARQESADAVLETGRAAAFALGCSAACSLGLVHCFAERWLPARPPTVGARTTDRRHSLRRGAPCARARRALERGVGRRSNDRAASAAPKR